jgi:hypothetical protein
METISLKKFGQRNLQLKKGRLSLIPAVELASVTSVGRLDAWVRSGGSHPSLKPAR